MTMLPILIQMLIIIYVSNNKTKFKVGYNTEDKKYSITNNGKTTSFEDLKEDQIKDEILYYPVLVSVIESFFYAEDKNIAINIEDPKKGDYQVNAVDDYEGTGLGFHKERKSAEYFCNKDHNAILKEHPTWCSPGVSVSCLWDNHACVCSAEYYSGSDC